MVYKYCYSWDDEDYSIGTYETEDEAIADAKLDRPEATQVYIGIATKPKLRWLSNEEDIIESMIEDLYDECGEYAEDALDISTEQELILGKMIDKVVEVWIEKCEIEPSCYIVNDSRLHKFE